MSPRTWIFAGRFQPFHNGHHGVAQTAASALTSVDTLVLGVVSPIAPDQVRPDAGQFAEIAAEHHVTEKNPWPLPVCLKALQGARSDLITRGATCDIVVTGIPWPEHALSTLRLWFPVGRGWIIPDSDDQFDEEKARFFAGNAELVWRVPGQKLISGTSIRDALKRRDYATLEAGIPSFALKHYLGHEAC